MWKLSDVRLFLPQRNVKLEEFTGYVTQEDILTGMLTVRENLLFSASLRMKGASKQDIQDAIDRILHQIGLTHIADSKIGNEFVRGISGGERKRANIGMELIVGTPLLFADEPTTGLDSNTAENIITLFKDLTHMGKTVCITIHQPKPAIFEMFDDLIIVAGGDIIFSGPSTGAVAYFDRLGFGPPKGYMNPADYFLHVVSHNSRTGDEYGQL